MQKTRLSFVVPVYKPDYAVLTKCCKSLKDQSIKSFEVIFVLDGKDEGAKDTIKQAMAGFRNYEILEIEHGGACKARNEGMRKAEGEFIVCFDADCCIEPDAADTWCMIFDKHPDIAFVYSGYRFLDSRGAIEAEPFDPWLLRVRNYISSCFPCRREFCGVWDESLQSLQDWDYWLQVVEKGGKGHYMKGYAFATAMPTPDSISGKGCTPQAWLDRVNAVKAKHNLPHRKICVSSLTKKHEGIWLAKLINADYQDIPESKPHDYNSIIQVGFSFIPGEVEPHCHNFSNPTTKKVVFYTCDDVAQVCTRLNLSAVWKYSLLLNKSCMKQYVEDKAAYDMMTRAGFNVEILPLPVSVGEAPRYPEKKRFLVDCHPAYAEVFNVLQKSLPDVELEEMKGAHKVDDFMGLCHFHPDKTVGISMKRAVLAGRHVVSNVQAPFMGFVDDSTTLDKFIPALVDKIRNCAYSDPPATARDYYVKSASPEVLVNVLA